MNAYSSYSIHVLRGGGGGGSSQSIHNAKEVDPHITRGLVPMMQGDNLI